MAEQYWNGLASRAILVLGSPRSGTTWLAKIFDSHPDVLYRHEPDELAPPRKRAGPAEQVGHWVRQRGLRAAGKRPFFRKSWRPAPLALMRGALAAGLAGAQRFPVTSPVSSVIALPDFVAPGRGKTVRAAVKLVNWDGSGALATMPGCRCCFILRHPCGQIASVMAGSAGGLFLTGAGGSDAPVDYAAAAAFAARSGVGAGSFAALPEAGRMAWGWRAFNEPAVEALQHRPNAMLTIYEELCRRPDAVARELFAFAGLDWHGQTSAFLATSTRQDRGAGYYDVFRVSPMVADRWRRSMGQQDQDAVRAVVRASPLARFWPDLASAD